MGWLFTHGSTRQGLIRERTQNWDHTTDDGMVVKTTCLAHCFRGGRFSGVLWAVWERNFTKDGQGTQPPERWITCDLLRYRMGDGWGYKDMNESMGPCYYFLSADLDCDILEFPAGVGGLRGGCGEIG